jgi:hypothetical protein
MAQNKGTAPKIISTIPAFGDCRVDPQLKEIILQFDQDMKDTYSVPDTKNFPQITDRAIWKDKRTFSIPVRLYQDRLYSLLLNSSKFQGFMNTEGVALNPEELHFRTKAVSGADRNKKAFGELTAFFPKQYSYASLKGIDWTALLETSRAELEGAESSIEFALKLVKLLKAADDPHLWVDVEGQKFGTSLIKNIEGNSNLQVLFSQLHDQKFSKDFMSVAGVMDSVGYLSIRDWETDFFTLPLKSFGNSKNPPIPAIDAVKELLKYPNLVIDVRENKGGNDRYARKFAALFASDSVAYEKVKYYNETSGKFDKEQIHRLVPGKDHLNYKGNIYVLSGPAVFSSNESFIQMMKQVPNAQVIGMKTYGSSGNPIPHELSNGVVIYLPSWQAYTLEGKLIEGNGVEPDLEMITTKEDFQNKDGLFEKVMNMIKKD